MTSEEKTTDAPAQEEEEEFLSEADNTMISDFLAFVNKSVSPFHAVQSCVELLGDSFIKLDETQAWDIPLKPGNYYFTRNQSTICAFVVPQKWKPGNGFTIMGAHTDSPVFRVKPRSKRVKEQTLCVGVEKYGGGLWHTWFDRDLSVAGRVMLSACDDSNDTADNNNNNNNNISNFESRLVRIERPILHIPNLAIHLNREVRNGFIFDVENHCVPLFASQACTQLNESTPSNNSACASPLNNDHHPLLLRLLAKEMNVDVDRISDFELSLYDTQASRRGGAYDEYVYSARLDNLAGTFVVFRGFLDSLLNQEALANETNIRMVASFDNEEVGSSSNRGAASNMLLSTLKRLNGSGPEFYSGIQQSILISCDNAHAVHPNYASKHETEHKPMMQHGLVLKYNCNQRYASNMISTFHLMEVSKALNLPLQKFVVKNTMPCGSTIGPILATRCGMRTVDVGIPQLSMHSIRESCGVRDIVTTAKLFAEYFSTFVSLDSRLKVSN